MQPKPDLIPVIDAEIISPSQWAAKPKSLEDQIRDDVGAEADVLLAICDEIAVSTKSVKAIAAAISGKSEDAAERAFHRARVRSTALSQLYMRARLSRADVMADEIIEIVDNEPDPHKARAKMDARKWVAGKLNRGLYGDDPITVQGPDGGAIKHEMEHRSGVLEELSRRLAKKAKALAREKKETGGEGEYGFENEGGEGDGSNPPLILPPRT